MKLNVDNGRTKLDLELVSGEENAAQQLIEQLVLGGFFNHGQRTQVHVQQYGRENTGYFLPPVHDVHAAGQSVHPYVQPPMPITVHDVQPVHSPVHQISLPESPQAEIPALLRTRRIKWGVIAVMVGVSIGSSVLAWKRLTAPSPPAVMAPVQKVAPTQPSIYQVPAPPPLGKLKK
jgi:hypothetical protein